MPELQLTDTHTHIYLPEFDADRDAAVKRALDAGVTRMILPNVDLNTIAPMHRLADTWPGVFAMAMGLHPSEIDQNWRDRVATVRQALEETPEAYVAVGEIGIDLYWDQAFEKEQMQAFDEQAALAEQLRKPVIIHCREGLPQVLEVLEGHRGLRGVFHCFGGDAADVRRIRERGDYYFGIGGVVTFKNSRLAEVLPEIGLERIVLETDSPYLAPVPHRGKRNESSFLPAVAARVAETLGKKTAEVAGRTSANSVDLFGF